MKNEIKYYYNMNPIEIHQINKIYKFEVNNKKYMLCPYMRNTNELKDIYVLHMYLRKFGILCHNIVQNNRNEILTLINEKPYILLNINIENRKININDINYISNIQVDIKKFISLKRQNWNELWMNKIDYIEYQISQFGKKYPLIRESIDYYIGLVETCITLLNNEKTEKEFLSISHNRININTTTEEFYNPLNYIIDNKIRDISEYLKSFIFEEEKILNYIKKYIQYNNLTNNDIKLLFVRLLYPSNYFDMYESILKKEIHEQQIMKIIKKSEIYEKNIKKIYIHLRSISELPEIEWLI